jgi:hypothetical protein
MWILRCDKKSISSKTNQWLCPEVSINFGCQNGMKWKRFFLIKLCSFIIQGWSGSYGSWIYNYLGNRCLQPLKLFESCSWDSVLYTTLCDKVCQWLTTGQWFSPGILVSSTNKTVRHDITEILLKVALRTKISNPHHWQHHFNGYYITYIYTCKHTFLYIFISSKQLNQIKWKKPLTCCKSLTNFITLCCIVENTSHGRDSNS